MAITFHCDSCNCTTQNKEERSSWKEVFVFDGRPSPFTASKILLELLYCAECGSPAAIGKSSKSLVERLFKGSK